jgi:TonB-linked SusC/RagA family outer membrane protein
MMLRSTFVLALLLVFGVSDALTQNRTITGRVTDATTARPLPGVQVYVPLAAGGTSGQRGATSGALTDREGAFQLTVPAGDVTIAARMIGYKLATLGVPAAQAAVQIALQVDVLNLDEVVVTGQATGISRRNLANSVAKVNAEELTRVPAASIEQALAGKIAGADIQSNSGAPGGGLQVRLRGTSTILGSSNPLYVVDGVIVSDAQIPSGVHAITRSSTNPVVGGRQDNSQNRISDLNPNDIESIEVLKGASAAAIYGSKANNGVVVITTKRGRSGEPQFSFSQRFGTFARSNDIGLRQFATLEDAVATFGARAADYWEPGVFFDHERELAGHTPLSYETSGSVSGGTDNTRYFASGLLKHDGGIITGTYYDKESIKLNLDQTVGARLTVGLNTNFIHTMADRGLTQNDNNGTSFYMAMPSTPSFIDLRQRPDGTWPVNPFAASNVLQTAALLRNEEEVYRFLGAGNITFDAINSERHGLRLLFTSGVDHFNQQNRIISPAELQFEPADGLAGTSVLGNARSLYLNFNTNAVHTLRPASGFFTATTSVGTQYEFRDLGINMTIGRNLIGGLTNVDKGTSTEVRQNRSEVKDFGIYVQEEVLFLDRLLMTAGVRADRGSNNSDTEQFYFYPKAAASYRFVSVPGFLDEVKLRAAWGQSGNQPLYGQKYTEYVGANIEGLPTVEIQGQTAASDIRPERQQEIEGGIDVIFLGSRGNLEVTGYEKRISDLLLTRQLAASTGFATSIFNGGLLRTRGLEMALMIAPVATPTFQWTSRTTFSMDRSELVELPVPQFVTGGFGFLFGSYLAQQGEPLTQLWGNARLADGSRVIQKVGDANPDFRMGFSNELRYGAVSMNSLWNWQQGGAVVNLTKYLFDLRRNSSECNQMVDGQNLCAKRFAEFPTNTQVYLEDGSFVKLRELSIGVDLPSSLVRSVWGGTRHARVNLSGRNLMTFTKYTGMDPEVSNFGNQAIARNIDVAPYPPSRSFWITFDFGF